MSLNTLRIIVTCCPVFLTFLAGCQPQNTPEIQSGDENLTIPEPIAEIPESDEIDVAEPETLVPAEIQEELAGIDNLEQDMEGIAVDLRTLHSDMVQLATEYPIVTRTTSVAPPDIIEKNLVHEVTFGTGNWVMQTWIPADKVDLASQHVENAYYLTNKGRLPSEASSRSINTDEIAAELNTALLLLETQITNCQEYKQEDIEWAQDSEFPEINRESTIEAIIEFYADYTEDFGRIVEGIESILSRLPLDTPFDIP
jgi:hypothetical protein